MPEHQPAPEPEPAPSADPNSDDEYSDAFDDGWLPTSGPAVKGVKYALILRLEMVAG